MNKGDGSKRVNCGEPMSEIDVSEEAEREFPKLCIEVDGR